jgi:uncharacterized membrane protein YedE/YeeE
MIVPYLDEVLGGVLIGLASSALLLWNGRVAGISGIYGGLLRGGEADRNWRLMFILGLLFAGLITLLLAPTQVAPTSARSLPLIALAGFLVGVGVRLGSGCTSGHGVCGISRLSRRSVIATVAFMATGMATATLLQLGSGGLG